MNSKNFKIGDIAATYLPIKQTCPASCSLRNNGCYAKNSYVGMHVSHLEKKMEGWLSYDIIRKEAREISASGAKANGKALRLHCSGDVRSHKAAILLREAAKKWDGKVYSYTHSWRDIPRKSWGAISILASVEKVSDAKKALRKGYAPAIVVAAHTSSKSYVKNGLKIIPCPSQTRNITCEKCKLCMNDKVLKSQKAAIGFAAHGVSKKRTLTVIQ